MAYLSTTFPSSLLPSWTFITSNYNAKAGDFLQVNTSSGPVTVTLPLLPKVNSVVSFADQLNSWSVNNVTIANNGQNIAGSSSALTADVSGATFYLYYVGGSIGWKIFTGTASIPGNNGKDGLNGAQGIPGNTSSPANAVAGNIATFDVNSGSLLDSGFSPSSFASATALSNLTNTVTNTFAFNQIDLAYLFLKTSALSGTQLGMIDGIVDPLNNLADINTTTSLGYLFNNVNGTVGLAPSIGYQFLTVSTGSQVIYSAQYDTSTNAAINAFDSNFSTFWSTTNSSANQSGVDYIGQDFGVGNSYAISQILFTSGPIATNITSVLVQYSDTLGAGSWTTVATASVNPATNALTTISIPASGSHRAWRVLANANATSGSTWKVTELNFQISIPVGSTVSNSSQAIANNANTSYPLVNAFDGATTSYWSSNDSTGGNGVSYIGQDFGVGNSYAIGQILHFGGPNESPTSVLLQYSDNMASWTTVSAYTMSKLPNAVSVISIPSGAGSHRGWRLLQNSVTVTYGWSVTELQFQIAGTLATVSNSAQAIADSYYQSSATYAPANAYDQSTASYWASNVNTASTCYIGQDFGSGNAYAIVNVIYTVYSSNYVTSWAIQYSDNASSWTTAVTYSGLVNTDLFVYNFSVPTIAGSHRYWRLLAVTTPGNAGAREVQFQTLLATKQVSTPTQAISGGDYAGYPALGAFDNSQNTFWGSSQSSGTPVTGNAWIGQDFGIGSTQQLTAFSITQIQPSICSVASTILQYSDNGSTWTSVGTYSLTTTGGSSAGSSSSNIYSVPSTATGHRYWRLLANANTSTASTYLWQVGEVSFYAAAPVVNGFTLQSVALPSAVASPSSARLFVQTDSTSTVPTLNTDIIVYVSRDGGTTFVPGTLRLSEQLTDGTTLYDTGTFSLASSPVGNSTMTFRIVTANSKNIVLTGVGMQVRP